MRKIIIVLALIVLVCVGCGIEPSQNSAVITVSPDVSNAPKSTATAASTLESTASETVMPELTAIPIIKDYKLSSDSIILKSGQKISDLENYFGLTENELIQELGNEYEYTGIGPEGHDCCYYEKFGISLIFHDAQLMWIECDEDKLELNGLTSGMNFEQIQERIGKKEITEKDNLEDMPEYDLTYIIGNIKLIFGSYTNDVKHGYWVTVCQADFIY